MRYNIGIASNGDQSVKIGQFHSGINFVGTQIFIQQTFANRGFECDIFGCAGGSIRKKFGVGDGA